MLKNRQKYTQHTPQFGQGENSQTSSFGTQKKYIRGPYKTKRFQKLSQKVLDYNSSENSNVSDRRHPSTLYKVELVN